MNILIINYEYPPIGAGAARQNHYLATELVRLGNNVIQLSSRFQNNKGISVEEGVTVERISAIRKKKNQSNMLEMITFAFSALLRVNRIVRTNKIEKVIVFFSIPCGPVALWAKWWSNVDYIVSLRGGDVPGYDIHLNTFHALLKPIRRLIFKNSKAIIANSKSLADLAIIADSFPVSVIENAVDSQLFKPLCLTKSTEKFVFLFVGRLHAIKNIDILLNWMKTTSKLNKNIELRIYGEGPEYNHINDFIVKYYLEEIVSLNAWVVGDQLVEVYNQADCFINPSFNEGLPNTVMEAMACGLPVIASNVVGNKDLIKHNINGLLFESNNLQDMANQCNIILSNPKRKEKYGKLNRQIILEKYTKTILAKKYFNKL